MSRRKRRTHPAPKRPGPAARTTPRLTTPVILLAGVLAVLGVAGLVAYLQRMPRETPSAVAPSFQPLTGRWLRPDGGYVLEIRDVGPAGTLTAAYFNPQPIKVAKAEALQERGTIKVFLELRDVGYPGSMYTLTYDPASDQLKGAYFQAALRQSFDVAFVRLK